MTIKTIQAEIERARKRAHGVFRARCVVAGVLSGASGMTSYELEFPEPDRMHAHLLMLGGRMGNADVYRLVFQGEKAVRWTGISTFAGLKLADIEVGE